MLAARSTPVSVIMPNDSVINDTIYMYVCSQYIIIGMPAELSAVPLLLVLYWINFILRTSRFFSIE